MDKSEAMSAFAALAQPTRLAVFRLLMEAAPDGLAAGAIAGALGTPHNTLSTHLGILARAGLIRVRRESRMMIYSADTAGAQALVAFLLDDCCGGRPDVCLPPRASSERSCSKAPAKTAGRKVRHG
jgi:DNA-binding transcriptional ArsR family regulator